MADAMRGRGVAQGRGASFAKKSTASRLGRWLKLPTKTRPRRCAKGVRVRGSGSCALATTCTLTGSRPAARTCEARSVWRGG